MVTPPPLIPALLHVVVLLSGPPGGWPVDDPHLVSGFRPPDSSWGAGHRGVDLAAETGEPVRAVAGGTVAFVGRVAGKPVVTIRLSARPGLRSTYEPVLGTVVRGTPVRAGDVIGTLAATGGHCGGDRECLHVGLRDGTRYLDPMTLMTRLPAVLKPE